ncbi:hypothetical protein JKP88DRAFT_265331 [Tribonema minus]|uniref:Elp3/MiaA/NifB-like radical SAM core domain-containing protein n=1 Tax=Tribonema minus TaxID=303371 RepID=A0A835YK67_9STRA|nr:hypothetical protein JKP88DRAFT_265331 [Tribonema minus]
MPQWHLLPRRLLRQAARRRLLLPALGWGRPKDPPISLGAASIVAALTHPDPSTGPAVEVQHRTWVVNSTSFDADEVVAWAMEADCAALTSQQQGISSSWDFAIGAFVWNECHVQHILTELQRRGFSGRLIVGGPQVSYVTHGVSQYYPQADVLIRGYAEQALHQLLVAEQACPDIPGVHYRGQPDRGLSCRTVLDELPSPLLTGESSVYNFKLRTGVCPLEALQRRSHETFDACIRKGSCSGCMRASPLARAASAFATAECAAHAVLTPLRVCAACATGVVKPQRFVRWETQRGCPFSCSFCQHRARGNEALRRRQFAALRVEAEIDWICANDVIQDVAVLDATFNSGPQSLTTLRRLAERGFAGHISLQCRLELITSEFLDAVTALDAGGARCMLEFGLLTIHAAEQEVIKRRNNPAKADAALAQCRARGIHFELSLMYGLPRQTVDSFAQSLERELGLVESTNFNTALGPEFGEQGRVAGAIPHVVASPSFSTDDWLAMVRMAEGKDA